ncbi:hypothetical protein TrST_g4095 [Triparma strigata]|uniref:CASTOR ACT domain-containing protein n=1 Tax=Triparma strigata TaxID=1606541 RepID=A0A9W7EFM4_9STRA|nr:hypothetical protein TrST_g4095 [Triparma strigata]
MPPKKKTKTEASADADINPFLNEFNAARQSVPNLESIFAPTTDADTRAEQWTKMCDMGEELVNKYAWAVPSQEAMDICKKLEPIVEVGAGQGYWGEVLSKSGVAIKSFDKSPSGGLIHSSKSAKSAFSVLEGDPAVLSDPAHASSTLLLCFPDEDSSDPSDASGDGSSDGSSLGLSCLSNFTGTHIIHVGELYPSALPLSQAPFGRTSTPEFQVALSTDFHCLKCIPLPRWPHESTTLSVWKRTEKCAITFRGEEGDDEEDEEEEYKYIPENEKLDDRISCIDWSERLKGIRMTLLEDEFTVAKYPPSDEEGLKVAATLITAVKKGDPRFVQVTDEEISIICQSSLLRSSNNLTEDKSWRCFKVIGPMPFYLVGIMAAIASVLKDHKISLLAQSTFDTDYVFVKCDVVERAEKVMVNEGLEMVK